MPLIDKIKMENNIILQFEGVVDECKTDKDDYIQELCEQMSIEQLKKPTPN